MRIKLVSLDTSARPRKIVASRLPMTIGRDPDAGIRLEDRWASRRHCEIDEINGTLVVRDLGSRHGTFVNGQSVTEAHVMPGDKLTVGLSEFQAVYKRGKAPGRILSFRMRTS